ncbi:hypothetical protein CAP36_11405 [Chitinophagaceae bacterium IBVUCB2]|nr:hypothetical protein CAP36_11405 [Chitinophagaceae bacterium IBVUCB2]
METLHERKEGKVAKAIETQTSKIPSDIFLWSAMGAAAIATSLHCTGKKKDGLFIGLLVAPILIVGLYNKLVKVEGHDKNDK